MCDLSESSREHAPPLCLFPEAKEFGRDERKNLITVPSCDSHNSNKSMDDEFFRAALTMMCKQGNESSRHQFSTKVLKAARRKPHAHSLFFSDSRILETGEPVVRIDRNRFDRCVDHLARAVFFHTYRAKWPYRSAVASPNFFMPDGPRRVVVPTDVSTAIQSVQEFLQAQPLLGDNPNTFQYKVLQERGAFGFAALFYQSVEIYAVSSREIDADLSNNHR